LSLGSAVTKRVHEGQGKTIGVGALSATTEAFRIVGRESRNDRGPLAPAGPPRHTRGMDLDEYDGYLRRTRRKYWVWVVAGIPFALVLGYLLLRAIR
jgi:hypothetical protein